MSSNLSYTKLTDRNVSFGLLRTNPKLTSNLKLTVDSVGNLWFNSIDATSSLASQKYKKFPIGENSNHAVNIFKFYDMGKTPNSISYALGSSIRTDVVAKDLKDQYDFDLYSSGAKYLTTKNYSEQFSYFAPLYVDKVLPEYFVILRIPGASNYTAGQWLDNSVLGVSPTETYATPAISDKTFALNLFQDATILKAIPLNANSKIGKYIRNMVADPMYPVNPLYVNFKESKYSLYRGASINAGTYVEIPEILADALYKASPQLKLEKYVTEGFERNNVIYPKILNLEFLFDDTVSDQYSFNRYLGFYCNAIDLESINIDLDQMYENEQDNDNPLPRKFSQSDDVSVNITNPNGIKLRASSVNSDLTFFNSALSNEDTLFFPYLRSKDNLHFLKIQHDDLNQQTFSQVGTTAEFTIDDTALDLGTMFGPNDIFSQELATAYTLNTRSTVELTLDQVPNHLDTIRVYHQNGSTFDRSNNDGRYDDIVFVSNYFTNGEEYSLEYPTILEVEFSTASPNDASSIFTGTPQIIGTQYISSANGSKWIWDGSNYVKGALGSRIYVNLENSLQTTTTTTIAGTTTTTTVAGTTTTTTTSAPVHTDLTQLAKTIVKIAKSLNNSFLTGDSFLNKAYIQTQAYGNKFGMLAVQTLQSGSAILINSALTQNVIYADGGFVGQTQAVIPVQNIDKILPVINDIVVKTDKNWSKILRVCNSAANINNETGGLNLEKTLAFSKYSTLMLQDEESTLISYDKIEIRNLFKPKFGILSIFDTKDIDFTRHISEYSKIPELDLYQYYYVPANTKILDFTQYRYTMIGSGSILINGQQIDTDSAGDNTVWFNLTGLHSYQVLSGDVILTKSEYLPYSANSVRLDIGMQDQDNNLQTFTGFFGLGADHTKPNQEALTYPYREKFTTSNLKTEYDIYLENYSTEFANEGKIIPYISKWGISNSTDSRGNTYRLNSDILFGKDNFGPSHRETAPTAEKLTHEWFYIESDFDYTKDANLIKKNYYYFDEPLSVSSLINESAYFERYFTYIPTFDGVEIDRPQFRYSKLIKDEFSNQYTTVFNGAKFVFSEIVNDQISITTDRFEDYNFSILLKPIPEDLTGPQSPVKFRVIENTNAKSILILIELALSDISQINPVLLAESLQFQDNRLDQTKLFLDENILNDAAPTIYTISAIYETLDDPSGYGDLEFTSLKAGAYPDVSNLSGTFTNPATGQTFSYTPTSNSVILVKKGSDPTDSQFIMAFGDSQIYTKSTSQQLLSGSSNGELATQFFTISQPAYALLGTTSSRIVRLYDNSTDSPNLTQIQLTLDNKLSIISAKPSYLGVFGDYRLKFNQNGVSNLTYNFIYAARDKKYNSTKSSFSTVKLATGVDISPTGVSITGSKYLTNAAQLFQMPELSFRLEDFVNPISASHDYLTNTSLGNSSPLPAFAPLMFIGKNGEISIPVRTSTILDSTAQQDIIKSDLSNSTITSHLLRIINDNILLFESPETIDAGFSSFIIIDPATTTTTSTTTTAGTTTTTTAPATTTTTTTAFPGIDLANDYTDLYLRATLSSVTSTPLKLGDIITVSDLADPTQYLIGQVTQITIAPNLTDLYLQFVVRSNVGSGSNSNDWQIQCKRQLSIIQPVVSATSIGPTISISGVSFPGGSSNTWLNSSQQFQLFGGKDYFANLFKNISFANFVKLLERNSPLISYETYDGGQLLENQKISIAIERADEINKNTQVALKETYVQTASAEVLGGFQIYEANSNNYEIFRYSGEYDILFRPLTGFKYSTQLGNFEVSGSNSLLNPRVADFFKLPEFSFVKYSTKAILDFEGNSSYKAQYPLIAETPIDQSTYNCLASSWDLGYHYAYFNKANRYPLAGTKRVIEDYSFVSKLLNVPQNFTVGSFNVLSVTNQIFENPDSYFANLKDATGESIDIIYSEYTAEIKLKFNLRKIIAKALINNGLRSEFQKFFKDTNNQPIESSDLLFPNSTFEQYLTNYTLQNLVKLYALDMIDFYEKPNYAANFSIADVPYNQLDNLDYSLIKGVKINNSNSAILSGSILKKPSTGISLVPKLKIKYI